MKLLIATNFSRRVMEPYPTSDRVPQRDDSNRGRVLRFCLFMAMMLPSFAFAQPPTVELRTKIVKETVKYIQYSVRIENKSSYFIMETTVTVVFVDKEGKRLASKSVFYENLVPGTLRYTKMKIARSKRLKSHVGFRFFIEYLEFFANRAIYYDGARRFRAIAWRPDKEF